MEKSLYSKPEIEVIEMEIQDSIMTASFTEDLDTSNTNGGEFESGSFWDGWSK